VTCWSSFTGGATDLPSLDCKTSCTRLFKIFSPRERRTRKQPCSRSCAAGSSEHRTFAAHSRSPGNTGHATDNPQVSYACSSLGTAVHAAESLHLLVEGEIDEESAPGIGGCLRVDDVQGFLSDIAAATFRPRQMGRFFFLSTERCLIAETPIQGESVNFTEVPYTRLDSPTHRSPSPRTGRTITQWWRFPICGRCRASRTPLQQPMAPASRCHGRKPYPSPMR